MTGGFFAVRDQDDCRAGLRHRGPHRRQFYKCEPSLPCPDTHPISLFQGEPGEAGNPGPPGEAGTGVSAGLPSRGVSGGSPEIVTSPTSCSCYLPGLSTKKGRHSEGSH